MDILVVGHVNSKFALMCVVPVVCCPVEQLPTITEASPSSLIAFPFDESFPMTCEAKGNPKPEFWWTKNGEEFDPYQDPRLIKEKNSGTFVIPNTGNLTEYQGTYRCYASNKLGTAITEEVEFVVPHVPKFPKEKIDPIEVEEGQPVILECNPPKGIPPLQIYWMTIGLQHIEQDDRVSIGLNGDLFFSNALEKDSHRDYCCFAAFPKIRTIVQKNAMSVIVKSTNSIMEREPSLLMPSGVKSETQLVKGDELLLECIAEGFPTPMIEWLKIDHRLPDRVTIENHGKLLSIDQVDEDDKGKYMCKATNIHGMAVHYFDVSVEEPPQWVSEPESQLSMIGSDVLINCSATGTPQPTIQWMVNGKPIEGMFSVYLNKTCILLRTSPGLPIGAQLMDFIVYSNSTDSAVYQCEASNRHGTLLANANIMIMSKFMGLHWNKEDSTGSLEGLRFTVHQNGSLEIYNVEKEDMGQYTCYTKNTEGTSAITALLDVKGIQLNKIKHFFKHPSLGPCINRLSLFFSADRYFIEDGILQIVNVSHRDQGMYKCVASTPMDQDTASALLMVLDIPHAPENLLLSEHKGRSVKLKWIPGEDHNSSTTEFIIEYEESQWEPGTWRELQRVPGNHGSAVLKLYGHVNYRFRVSGVNTVGRGRPSEPTERYKTPPAAPDKNPENIKIEGHLPHEMDINWEPLSPIEHNGPGLEYKVSYKRQHVEEDWQEHLVKRHSFVVKDTPTFVPYEIRIQARNHHGWGPEPKVVTGYSGEDFPSAAPDDVAVEVMNNSLVKVSWMRVHKDKLHGHLGGYRISWWRLRSLLDSKKTHGDKHTLTFPGDRNHAMVPGLTPFSEYSLIIMTFNRRGNGPGSHAVNFKTPEGVPERTPVFRVTDVQKHTVTLTWAPPLEANGVLTGYLLEYQLINNTEEVGVLQTVDISNPDTTMWVLQNLEAISRYKFYLRPCTRVGCGPRVSKESTTTPERGQRSTGNISEAVNSSKTFHVIEGLELGTVYTVRLMTNNWVDNTSIFEYVIRTRAKVRISTQGWFIGLMCVAALLTLMVLIACFVNRNKGGKYSVKEKEDLHPDLESQGIHDDTFCEYSDNDEKPLKGSQHSLSGQIKAEGSGDSLVDYGDEDIQFNEDGSFIGEYAGRKEKKGSMEVKGTTNQSTA
uniref:Neural cell adhesion molecule L1-like protein n=1 Tax=Oncorhynchus tshawytscha TaxID=74940 RepID=A0A8C8D6Y1_ONCTS